MPRHAQVFVVARGPYVVVVNGGGRWTTAKAWRTSFRVVVPTLRCLVCVAVFSLRCFVLLCATFVWLCLLLCRALVAEPMLVWPPISITLLVGAVFNVGRLSTLRALVF